MFENAKAKAKDFWKRPYSSEMDATSWILFLVFILIVSAGWASVLRKLKEV